MLMKYEDLVSQPKEMAVKLYHFINASEDIDYALQYLESHYKNDQPTSKYVSGTLIFLRFELFVSETFFSMYVCILNLKGMSYVLKNDHDYQPKLCNQVRSLSLFRWRTLKNTAD